MCGSSAHYFFASLRGLQEWRLEFYRPQVQYDYEQNGMAIEDPHFAFPQPVEIKRYMFKNTHHTIQLDATFGPILSW